MWIYTLYVVIIILIILLLISLKETNSLDKIISNLRKGAKKSKKTYNKVYANLERRAGRVRRLEKQVKGFGSKPVK